MPPSANGMRALMEASEERGSAPLCSQGHEFESRLGMAQRRCRRCRNAYVRAWRAERKARGVKREGRRQ